MYQQRRSQNDHPRQQPPTEQSNEETLCYNCNKPGHYKSHFPLPIKKKRYNDQEWQQRVERKNQIR
ncbi:hypothetical protein GJQ66_13635, partial [Microbacterium sp. ZXX196]|nr:hypothetical protein [Microbacterium sp. ZXX196]